MNDTEHKIQSALRDSFLQYDPVDVITKDKKVIPMRVKSDYRPYTDNEIRAEVERVVKIIKQATGIDYEVVEIKTPRKRLKLDGKRIE